ncbi:amino acid ABC transporter ATP-binding/permease protein [Treponema phagedenis]|uniref:amino acid ABC transporter ATP-binding/permease protein n=1 Tax=Treponema phagedenis TaxID=162 RepID=UPI0001F6392D|nr:ABC transporter ATP-binding protein [Treponema phagedenis]EFW36485.1 ABC transporter, ATP-binding protein [Treponema phagedenis F0421]TYT78324.1 ABC transporter ATP-binding protein [Treponema phagedenis]
MRYTKFQLIIKLFDIVKPLLPIMVITIIAGVAGFMAATFIPVLGAAGMLQVLQVSGAENLFTIKTIIVLLGILSLSRGVLRYLEQLSGHYIAFKLLALIRDKVFESLRKLAFVKLQRKDSGQLLSIITADIELLEVFYAHTIAPVSIAVICSSIFIFLFVRISWIFASIAAIAYLVLGLFLPLVFSKKEKTLGTEYRAQVGDLNAYFLESLRGMKEIFFFNLVAKREATLEEKNNKVDSLFKRIKNFSGLNRAVSEACILIFDITMVAAASILFASGSISFIGMVISAVLFMSSFGPVIAVTNLSTNLIQTFASAERVISLLEEKPEITDVTDKHDIRFETLALNSVSFAYDTEEVLKNISFTAEKNTIIGIHGKSGSGKSTLLKLIMRFYDPQSGNIKINNTDLKEINTASLREAISYVTQHTYVFNKSVYENLIIANRAASKDTVIAAAKKANLHDFVLTLPQGYDTKIAELGLSISGGERQRIGVARAFLHQAPLILLDEPTSNLDSLNEAVILQSLLREKENKTILLVSHRKSTMGIADTVINIDSGRIS